MIVNTGQLRGEGPQEGQPRDPTRWTDENARRLPAVIQIDINERVKEALARHRCRPRRCSAARTSTRSGLMYWLYSRPLEPTLRVARAVKFAKRPEIVEANQKALQAGYNAGDIHEMFQGRYEVPEVRGAPAQGHVPQHHGQPGAEPGAGRGRRSWRTKLELFCGSYPITPASSILEFLSRLQELRRHDRAGRGRDRRHLLGASAPPSTGWLGVTSTSGTGHGAQGRGDGLAVSIELPLVIVDIQRGGPSTGLPTKTEQADLLQACSAATARPRCPVVACARRRTPSTVRHRGLPHRGPVHDAGRPALRRLHRQRFSEPWRLPKVEDLEPFPVEFMKESAPRARNSCRTRATTSWRAPG